MFLEQKDTKAAKEMLEATYQEIMVLKTRLDAIQVKYESAEKEIEGYIPQIQDLERSITEFRSAAYAKDEELIAAYNQVIHFKKVVDRLEPQVLELQSALKINDNLKKEIEELQGKNFDTFSISQEDLLSFTFESSIGEVVGKVGAQARAAEGKVPENAVAENIKAAEDVVTE
ncbi:uncharacterized protein LOC126611758 [Malus sylvestris]|uniref:uncharacterized protein LOC126611758 n=1 Tax=Malus sylvestris TaxID=3752 RepID=UPI0021ACECC8|nr:uncharacterized protein LOC126611758 [Malus sylvestris]